MTMHEKITMALRNCDNCRCLVARIIEGHLVEGPDEEIAIEAADLLMEFSDHLKEHEGRFKETEEYKS